MKILMIELVDKFKYPHTREFIDLVEKDYSSIYTVKILQLTDKKYHKHLINITDKTAKSSIILCQVPVDLSSNKEIDRLYYNLINSKINANTQVYVVVNKKYQDCLIASKYILRYQFRDDILEHLDKIIKKAGLIRYDYSNYYYTIPVLLLFIYLVKR